jgi:magnesium transporter
MKSIEPSSRLYKENDALYMTATLIVNADTDAPEITPVGFVLKNNLLITIRYGEPKAFRIFAGHLLKHADEYQNGSALLCGLLETIIERAAEILEFIGADADKISHSIFTHDKNASEGQSKTLKRIAFLQNTMAKMRDSLVSLSRMIHFSGLQEMTKAQPVLDEQMRSIDRDIQSLSDQASFLSSTISFLLNASLGLINMEQNGIIKFFSVVAVVFLPPTLIASIYGMNFDFMPELHWHLGYPLALILMLLSAICPYAWFKHKGWF